MLVELDHTCHICPAAFQYSLQVMPASDDCDALVHESGQRFVHVNFQPNAKIGSRATRDMPGSWSPTTELTTEIDKSLTLPLVGGHTLMGKAAKHEAVGHSFISGSKWGCG